MKKYYLWLFLILSIQYANAQKNSPYLILVSFDGFRYDYVENFNLSHFKKFIAEGIQAESLLPSYPSKTFPNHYTIVTGLYPNHHGIVDNSFYDKTSGETYQIGDRKMVENPKWYQGTPIWILAKDQGIRTASYFWVGSETLIQGKQPDYWYPYNSEVENLERVQQVLDWLQLPESERPHLITLYFSLIDDTGHKFGTEGKEIENALLKADSLLGMLVEGLNKIGIDPNILLVSDHGMQNLENKEEYLIGIEDYADFSDSTINIVSTGFHTHIYAKDTLVINRLYLQLKQNQKHFSTYKKEEIPEYLHYNTNPNIGDILVIAEEKYTIGSKKMMEKLKTRFSIGNHGYDATQTKSMQGIFYAKGPNMQKGLKIPTFENIHIYPLMAKILGLKINEKIDGSFEVLKKVYRK